VTPNEGDRFGDSACDATHLVPSVDQQYFDHIGDHQVIFGNQNLEHAQSSPERTGELGHVDPQHYGHYQ